MPTIIKIQQSKYCLGRKEIKLCCGCINKFIGDKVKQLPEESRERIKTNMREIDGMVCKISNGSFFRRRPE